MTDPMKVVLFPDMIPLPESERRAFHHGPTRVSQCPILRAWPSLLIGRPAGVAFRA
ncbi:MAG: hypothetical protein F2838_09900 [Actinobacteria bacterium]|nr:hypothetical protein [Actinomycetota bacterium]